MHLRVIIRNIFSTWVGYAATLVVGFFLAPFVVHHLGNAGYGVWTLVTALTGYFGMLDLGLRQSVGRFVARYIALNDEGNVNRTISSALGILAGAGALALSATATMNLGFGFFKVDYQLAGAARLALLLAGLNISLALPMSVFNAVLFALERFDIVTGITFVGALTRAALVVHFLNRGYGIIALALITLLESTAEYLAAAIWAKRLYPPLRPAAKSITLARCKELFGFGIYRFIWIVANQLIFYTDSVVIGVFLSASAITFYAISGSLINYGRNIVSLASDTLYPAATRLDAKNDMAGLRNLQLFGTRIALLVGVPICLGFFFLGKQFIVLWMGPAYAVSSLYLIVLTIPQFSSMAQYTSALILVGMGKHRALAFLAMAEGILNLTLSIFLVRRIGLVGVAWGTVIPHLINTAFFIPAYTLRVLNLSWSEYLVQGFARPLLAAFPATVVCFGFSTVVANPTWPLFIGEVLATYAVFGVSSYFVCLTPRQKAAVLDRVRAIVTRQAVTTEA